MPFWVDLRALGAAAAPPPPDAGDCCTLVKNDKRGACKHKAATVLPNRTTAT